MSAPKAYSYIRMSTPDQLRGDSLRRQLVRTQRYADANGLEIVERFDDLGVSAFRGRNVEFGALKHFRELVDSGEIAKGSYLIVESMDRLSRDRVMKAFSYLSEIIGKGIIVVTLDDQQKYSEETIEKNPFGIMFALGAMARAHDESRRKAGLLSDVWDEKKRKARAEGQVMTRRMPAWLSLDKATRKIVVIEERAIVVREIFTLIRDGWGAYSLSRHLNQRGERPWSERKNSVWRESYIKKIIASRTVLGEYQPRRLVHGSGATKRRVLDGDPVIGYYPQVVDEQLFGEAQLSMSRRRITGRGRKGPTYTNLFTGVLRCSCGAGYRYINKGKPPKGGQYLQCSVAFARGACKVPALRYQVVETIILDVLERLDVERVLGGRAKHQRLAERRHDLSMLQIEAGSIQKKIDHVLEAITDDDSQPKGRLKKKLEELESEYAEKARQIDSTDREIEEMVDADPERRKKAIDHLLREIRKSDGESTELIRRALVSEIQRMIGFIALIPTVHVLWEIVDADPDWKKTYKVRSKPELERLLRDAGFELRIHYRSGDLQVVDALSRSYLKLKGDRKLKDWQLAIKAEQT